MQVSFGLWWMHFPDVLKRMRMARALPFIWLFSFCDLDIIKHICLAHKEALSHKIDGAVPLFQAESSLSKNQLVLKFLLED